MEAVRDAGLDGYTGDKERVGVCIGSGIGGLPMIEDTKHAYLDGGPRKISPFFVPGSIINMVAGLVSIHYGYQGPNLAMVSACSTANHSIGEAARIIEYGDADVMVAGGTESTVSPLGMGGFCAARALSTRNDDPDRRQPPLGHRPRRLRAGRGRRRAGARGIRARQGARRAHLLRARGLRHERRCAPHHRAARRRPRRGAQHGQRDAGTRGSTPTTSTTSTPTARRRRWATSPSASRSSALFGDHADKLAVSSTKSMTGHLLGAAGGIEAVFTALALRDQVAPPTANLVNRDPKCDLDFVPLTARAMKIRAALSNSFGFGGTNATLVFRRALTRRARRPSNRCQTTQWP